MLTLEDYSDLIPLGSVLGLRFWDPARALPITGDLIVRARHHLHKKWTEAIRTPSGNYSFPRMSGVNSTDVMGSQNCQVWVRDKRNRFLDSLFQVSLPLAETELYHEAPLTVTSPPQTLGGTILYSNPARATEAAQAVIRARLWNVTDNVPAAHAVLEAVSEDGELFHGVSDARGELLLAFPYPRFGMPLGTSPPTPPQSWPLDISVRYQPGNQVVDTETGLTTRESIASQGSASIIGDGPAVATLERTLTYRKDLVLRTDGSLNLHIQP